MHLLVSLAFTLSALALPLASSGEAPAAAPLGGLADLEARAPKENRYPNPNPKFHEEAVKLVESGALTTGDEFYRASHIVWGPILEYRSVRIRYELLLSAAAKNNRDAEKELPEAWDQFLLTLGRPMRFDSLGQSKQSPGDELFQLDSAPGVIQAVMLKPGPARELSAKAADNPEVKAIVDQDQAIRANFGNLTQSDMKDMAARDHKRNLRIREIIEEGGLHTAKDFANASLVMQHSSAFAGFELAHELAVCSMLLG